VATDAQRTARNLEDLYFIFLDVVVNRAPICIHKLCGCRYPYDLHVLTTTRAPDLLPLYQRGRCFVHRVPFEGGVSLKNLPSAKVEDARLRDRNDEIANEHNVASVISECCRSGLVPSA
jgi:hypothetical protein